MARPITLFTGQWADLPLAELAPLAREMGYDGLEPACWGDHFDVAQALASPSYVRDKRALLAEHGLRCFAIGNHLVGQAVCGLIDARHEAILPARVWDAGCADFARRFTPILQAFDEADVSDPRRNWDFRSVGRGMIEQGGMAGSAA